MTLALRLVQAHLSHPPLEIEGENAVKHTKELREMEEKPLDVADHRRWYEEHVLLEPRLPSQTRRRRCASPTPIFVLYCFLEYFHVLVTLG